MAEQAHTKTETTVYLTQLQLSAVVVLEAVGLLLVTQEAAVAAVRKAQAVAQQIKHRLLVLQAMAMLAAVVEARHFIQQGEAVALTALAALVAAALLELAAQVLRRQ